MIFKFGKLIKIAGKEGFDDLELVDVADRVKLLLRYGNQVQYRYQGTALIISQAGEYLSEAGWLIVEHGL